jgi:hypothetical protein
MLKPTESVYCVPRFARLRWVWIDPSTGRSKPTALSLSPERSLLFRIRSHRAVA